MTLQEMEARIFSLEALVGLLIEELPKSRQSEIVTKLLERACGDRGQAEVAESWDDEIRGGPRTPEGSRIELWHSRRRRDEIFGFEQ